jgi:hypothetical protein
MGNGGDRRSLSERVAQVGAGAAAEEAAKAQTLPRLAEARRAEPPVANGRNGKLEEKPDRAEEAAEPAVKPAVAAEMPQAPEISEKRRRPRLLDRITSLAKSS